MKCPRRSAIALAVALVVGGCASAARVSEAPGTIQPAMPSVGIQSAMPSSAISQDRAVQQAQEHTSLTTLVSVQAGRFGDLNTDSRIGSDYPIKADDLVGVVRFSGDITICNPLGVCYSPRPATTTVYLDYATGEFRTSGTFSPANGRSSSVRSARPKARELIADRGSKSGPRGRSTVIR